MEIRPVHEQNSRELHDQQMALFASHHFNVGKVIEIRRVLEPSGASQESFMDGIGVTEAEIIQFPLMETPDQAA